MFAAVNLLAARQHGVVTRAQLEELGLNSDAIRHRMERGRLHVVRRGVYALGRPELTICGHWSAAVLACLPATLEPRRLERAINEADRLSLADPERLRTAINECGPAPGVRVLRKLLDRRTFVLTDSELERRFVPIARKAGLDRPLTRQVLNGYRVDFYWPQLGLVVETDGLR